MKTIILSFRSRNALYSFSKILNSNNIKHSVINTPRTISTSCGLSIKTSYNYFSSIANILRHINPPELIGAFAETNYNNFLKYEKIF